MSVELFGPPRGLGAIRQAFGELAIRWDDKKRTWLLVDPTWERQNMVLVTGLPLVPLGRIYCHRLVAEPMKRALASAAGLGYAINSFGCWSLRVKRTVAKPDPGQIVTWDDGLSIHAPGAAFDVNAHANPLQPRGPGPMVTDMPEAFVECWTREGFLWGGHFTGPHLDPMHFQYATGY